MTAHLTHSNDTKERILDAAEAIMLEKGFNGVGINEILKSANIPKGSFYHWFPSKEQFGVELLNHYGADAMAHKEKWLLNRSMIPSAYDRFIAYLESGITCFIENECRQICLIVKLSAEVCSWSDNMRETLERLYNRMRQLYQTVIEEGQAQGTIRKDLDANHFAAVIHDAWLGAYIRAAVSRSIQPGRDIINFAKAHLAP